MKSNFAVCDLFMPGTGRSAAGIGVVVLTATTIAATPGFAQSPPATIDAADTAWMIMATGLVLMMSIPGLALFYCGMVRKKNVLATMAPSGTPGLLEGNPGQLLYQLYGIAATLAWSGAVTFLLLKGIAFFVPLRVGEQAEVEGLDVTQHGEALQ